MFKMTPTIFRNLFSRKATRLYPHQTREAFDAARGRIYNEIERCNFCGICSAKCPSQCISVSKKNAIWKYEYSACIFCGICASFCPKGCLHQQTDQFPPVLKLESVTFESVSAADGRQSC
jgi:ech hydrogenase subunit F